MSLLRIPPSRCTGTFREEYLTSDEWVAEPKLDGGRYMLYLEDDGSVHLFSRRDFPRIDKAANVPHFAKTYTDIRGVILDGEVICAKAVEGGLKKVELGETTGILNSLPAKAIARQQSEGFLYYITFDCLAVGGKDIRSYPLHQRRGVLCNIVNALQNPYVKVVEQHADKDSLFRAMVENGLEGTVIKNLNSIYGVNWVKCKRVADFSVIVTGFQQGEGKYATTLGAVLFSVYKDGKLVEVGKASGMTDAERDNIWHNRDRFLGQVIDVSAQEVTAGGRMRHPRWLRVRDDVAPETCTFSKLLDDAKKARKA